MRPARCRCCAGTRCPATACALTQYTGGRVTLVDGTRRAARRDRRRGAVSTSRLGDPGRRGAPGRRPRRGRRRAPARCSPRARRSSPCRSTRSARSSSSRRSRRASARRSRSARPRAGSRSSSAHAASARTQNAIRPRHPFGYLDTELVLDDGSAAHDRLRARRRGLRRRRPRRACSASSTRSCPATRCSTRPRTTGSRDEFSRGTWAIHRPGWYTHHHAEMQRPEGRVLLAGSDLANGWAGFIDGAIESGLTAAARARAPARLTPAPGRVRADASTAPRGAAADHRVELDQLEVELEQRSPTVERERRDARRGRPARGRAPPVSSGAPRSARSARSIRAALAGQRHDRDVVEQLGPDAAEPDHERRHDRVAAGGDDQLDAGRGHPLDEHAPRVRGRERASRRYAAATSPASRSPSSTPPSSDLCWTAALAELERDGAAELGQRAPRASSSSATTRPSTTATPRCAQQLLGLVLGQPLAAGRVGARRRAAARRSPAAAPGRPAAGRSAGGAAQPGAQPGDRGDAGLREPPRGVVVEQLGQRRGDDRRHRAAPRRRRSIPSRTASPRLLDGAVEVRGSWS